MKRRVAITISILAILLGGFCVVAGERDDSPGLQGIGVIVGILGVVGVVRIIRKRMI